MRAIRPVLLAAATVSVLSATAVATAARGPAQDGTLSVRDGRGTLILRLKGGVIGRFARGKLTVTDPGGNDGTIVVRGEERQREVNERTTVYSGRNIRFRIADEQRFGVKIEASKINLSAVGRGEGWIDGRGDPDEGVYFDGSWSLNGADYRSLPDVREHFDLEAPPSAD